MIQRIQTLYIIAGTLIVLGVSFMLPYLTCLIPAENLYFIHGYGAMIWLFLFTIFSLVSILKFNNRKVQLYYLNGNILGLLSCILLIYVSGFYTNSIFDNIVYSINVLFIFFYCISLVFFLLAKRAIKKDDALIKSIDRIR